VWSERKEQERRMQSTGSWKLTSAMTQHHGKSNIKQRYRRRSAAKKLDFTCLVIKMTNRYKAFLPHHNNYVLSHEETYTIIKVQHKGRGQ
jgi:hypothetical protein